jgi:hypothetical protein
VSGFNLTLDGLSGLERLVLELLRVLLFDDFLGQIFVKV